MELQSLRDLVAELRKYLLESGRSEEMSDWLLALYDNGEGWLGWDERSADQQQVGHFMRAAYAMHALKVAKQCPGGNVLVEHALQLLRSGAYSQFEDRLFEAETGLYFIDGWGVDTVHYGPLDGNPDLTVFKDVNGRNIPIVVECKRISPRVPEHRHLDEFTARLEKELSEVFSAVPCKVIVRLHRRATQVDVSEVAAVVRRLMDSASAEQWATESPESGSFQASVSPLGAAGRFQQAPIDILDVAVEQCLRVASELERTDEGDLVRMEYVLSLRSDIIPDRVGKLVNNARRAISQLARSAQPGNASAVAIRIRPPVDRGGVMEADGLLRALLKQAPGTNASVGVFFWDEYTREEGEQKWIDAENWERSVRAGYRLAAHVVPGVARGIDFSLIDSRPALLPIDRSVLIRDPNSGSLVPISLEAYSAVLAGSDAPGLDVTIDPDELAGHDNSLYCYLQLAPDYWDDPMDSLAGVVTLGDRQFRTLLLRDFRLQCTEIRNGDVVSVATIDTHAWKDTFEILYFLVLEERGFRLGLVHRVWGRVWAESAPMRALPAELPK